jgi:mono/diheme cytochrome c family protein
MQLRSVAFHARRITPPELKDAALVRQGLALYRELCVSCHGAPGVDPDPVGRGMNPNPPRLALAAPDYADREIYWIIKNGFKMAGMPGFEVGHTERELWALTAFVRRIPQLSDEEYERMQLVLDGTLSEDSVPWLPAGDQGLARMRTHGDSERGRALLGQFGCGSCHVIPGVPRAAGSAGPPLFGWSDRHYIAGLLINNPDNLVRWIVDPQRMDPGTVMPALGVDSAQALDIAAYLFTLGKGLPPAVAIEQPERRRDGDVQP